MVGEGVKRRQIWRPEIMNNDIEDIVIRVAAGEPRAADRLLSEMSPMIGRWLKRFMREFQIPVAHRDDVRQEICLAVTKAATMRSPESGYSWESYAYFKARDAALQFSRSPAVDGLSQASMARRRAPRISSIRGELARRYDRPPTEAEIVERFNETANTSGRTSVEEVRLVIGGRFDPLWGGEMRDTARPPGRPLISPSESNAFMLRVLARCAVESVDLGQAAEALLVHLMLSAPSMEPVDVVSERLGCGADEAEGLLARVYASIVDELGDEYAPISEWMRQTRSAPLASAPELASAVGCSVSDAEYLIREIRSRAFDELTPSG